MKKLNLISILLLFLAATVLACQPGGSQPFASQEPEIFPATILDIRIEVFDTSPPQVMAYIKSPIPDTCTAIDELKTERSDSTIDITLTIKRTPAAGCRKAEGYFMQNVNLGSDFVSGQTYTIKVNDKTTSFVME